MLQARTWSVRTWRRLPLRKRCFSCRSTPGVTRQQSAHLILLLKQHCRLTYNVEQRQERPSQGHEYTPLTGSGGGSRDAGGSGL